MNIERAVKRGIVAIGKYTIYIDGKEVGVYENLVPDEGLNYLLRVGVLGHSQISTWYVALFSGNVDPEPTWTAANFSANASEIVSSTQGYSESSRPAWTPQISSNFVSNANSVATFTIVGSSPVQIRGSALLSSSGKGSTSGILLSAVRYPSAHIVNDGSTFQVRYDLMLHDL